MFVILRCLLLDYHSELVDDPLLDLFADVHSPLLFVYEEDGQSSTVISAVTYLSEFFLDVFGSRFDTEVRMQVRPLNGYEKNRV